MNTSTRVAETKTVVLDANVVELPNKPKVDVKREIQLLNENGEVNVAALTTEDKERFAKLNRSLVVTDINSISNYEFKDCSNLIYIELPSKVKIGNEAFNGCVNLEKIIFFSSAEYPGSSITAKRDINGALIRSLSLAVAIG